MPSPELEVPSPEDKKDFRSDNHLQIQSMLLVFCHIDCMWNVIVCACIATTETDMEGLLIENRLDIQSDDHLQVLSMLVLFALMNAY